MKNASCQGHATTAFRMVYLGDGRGWAARILGSGPGTTALGPTAIETANVARAGASIQAGGSVNAFYSYDGEALDRLAVEQGLYGATGLSPEPLRLAAPPKPPQGRVRITRQGYGARVPITVIPAATAAQEPHYPQLRVL